MPPTPGGGYGGASATTSAPTCASPGKSSRKTRRPCDRVIGHTAPGAITSKLPGAAGCFQNAGHPIMRSDSNPTRSTLPSPCQGEGRGGEGVDGLQRALSTPGKETRYAIRDGPAI